MNGLIKNVGVIKFITRLVNTGCNEDIPNIDRHTLQFLNGIALFRFFGGLPYIVFYLVQGKTHDWSSNLPNILSTFLVLCTLYFNSKKLHLAAAIWGNLFLSIPLFINLWFFFGPDSGSYFFFILLSLVPIVTIPAKHKALTAFLSATNIIFFLLIRNHVPLYGNPSEISNIELFIYQEISTIATLLLIVATFIVFKRMIFRNEKLLEQKGKQMQDMVERANTRATIDSLTGLCNRRKIEESLQADILRSTRYGNPLSLIMFDLDHFKRINDTLGHDLGDQVLIKTGELAASTLRTVDLLGRWGGEEFLIIMPHTTQEGALLVAEKLRQRFEDHWHDRAGIVTASFGVAEWVHGESYDEFIKRVDNAMYRAKNGGRNLVSISMEQAERSRVSTPLVWTLAWETGNATIDAGHKQIIDTVNKYMELSANQTSHSEVFSRLNDLYEILKKSFQHEEGVLAKSKFPGYATHLEEHQSILDQMHRMTRSCQHMVVNPLLLSIFITEELVVGHLINFDLEYHPYLEKVKQTNN